jgi:hypothetical protein
MLMMQNPLLFKSLEQLRQSIQKTTCRWPADLDKKIKARDQRLPADGVFEDITMVRNTPTTFTNRSAPKDSIS